MTRNKSPTLSIAFFWHEPENEFYSTYSSLQINLYQLHLSFPQVLNHRSLLRLATCRHPIFSHHDPILSHSSSNNDFASDDPVKISSKHVHQYNLLVS